jgi:hypothetical protein
MINLLPNATKNQIRYARWNVTAAKYIMLTLLLLASIGTVTLFGLFYIKSTAQPIRADNEVIQVEVTKLAPVQKEAENLSNKIKLINAIFDKNTDYTEIITRIGSALPPGARISSIALTPKSFDEPITLSVDTASHQVSASVLSNFKDPTIKLFATADLESTVCSPKTGESQGLPCTTSIRAVFSKEAFKKQPSSTSGGQQ